MNPTNESASWSSTRNTRPTITPASSSPHSPPWQSDIDHCVRGEGEKHRGRPLHLAQLPRSGSRERKLVFEWWGSSSSVKPW
jgi:hypothetical protein